jgi:hypothetical protein
MVRLICPMHFPAALALISLMTEAALRLGGHMGWGR